MAISEHLVRARLKTVMEEIESADEMFEFSKVVEERRVEWGGWVGQVREVW